MAISHRDFLFFTILLTNTYTILSIYFLFQQIPQAESVDVHCIKTHDEIWQTHLVEPLWPVQTQQSHSLQTIGS